MAKSTKTPAQYVAEFKKLGINLNAPITKGFEGIRFQSAAYGCYDRGMPPHPEWDVPEKFRLSNGKEAPVFPVYYIGSNDNEAILTATYHPFRNFVLPKKSTFMSDEDASTKLSKNKRKSLVLYMSPVTRNSFALQTCAMASVGCEMACLDYSGQKVGQQKQRLAIARTDFYFAHREAFFQRVYDEIMDKDERVNKGKPLSKRSEVAVRLNGTSDLPLFDQFAEWCVNKKLRMPANIVFYDYTKFHNRATTSYESEIDNAFLKMQPDSPVRHKVTFSLSEVYTKSADSKANAIKIMQQGGTIAAVFLTPPKGIKTHKKDKKTGGMVKVRDIPKTPDGTPYVFIKDAYYFPLPEKLGFEDENGNKKFFPVIDGDLTDDLMLEAEAKGAVLGLRAKMRAQHDTTGFAIPALALFNPKDKKATAYIKEVILDMSKNRAVVDLACNTTKATRPPRFKCSDEQIKEGNVIDVW
jgi:hypothetical protein